MLNKRPTGITSRPQGNPATILVTTLRGFDSSLGTTSSSILPQQSIHFHSPLIPTPKPHSGPPPQHILIALSRSNPAVPGALNSLPKEGEPERVSDSPLTPIESEGPSWAPSPKGQGYESALSEPEDAESGGPAEKNPEFALPSGMAGGRVETLENQTPEIRWTDEPTIIVKPVVNRNEQRNSLSLEQKCTLQLAEANLSPDQRRMVRERQNSVRILNEEDESQGEGPSSGKGKGVNPQNWGNVDLSNDEADPEIQTQILASMSEMNKRHEASSERCRMYDMIDDFQAWQRKETERIEAIYHAKIKELQEMVNSARVMLGEENLGQSTGSATKLPGSKPEDLMGTATRKLPSRPSDLIANTSHVGKLFSQLSMANVKVERPEEVDLANADSSTKKVSGMKIKPLKPTEIYDGTASLHSFQRNMREIIAYLEDGQVPEYRQVKVASRFLKGKAYTFFERVCGESSGEWTLRKFYEKLYDFAFPIDLWTEQRRKLVNLQQRNRRVRDHVGISNDLCNTAGMLDERHKVIFLWDSFEPFLIKGLLHMGHTPKTSSLEDLIADTEKVELIECVGKGPSIDLRKPDSARSKPYGSHLGKNPLSNRYSPRNEKGGTPEKLLGPAAPASPDGSKEKRQQVNQP
ncbi:hypothetical protein F5890DRAFT_1557946 [Lentinula detonsa]|uniref:Retrotransposon gag domain-containing protein n=1 Tax=Lentinula detonsa TaxID=2804962 RepID=A0AA38UP02_9AGAR|nr:hypothetical protein F5890DRAFT_1557946 [Lentinula detonsa]